MSRWQALLTGEIKPGVYRLPAGATSAAVHHAVEPAGWRVFFLDGDKIDNKASFLTQAALAMNFPKYFGNNWDAFEDAFNDLGWVPAKGYVVVYPHANRLAKSPDWKTALSIFQDAAERWQKAGTPFYILLGGVDNSLPQLSS